MLDQEINQLVHGDLGQGFRGFKLLHHGQRSCRQLILKNERVVTPFEIQVRHKEIAFPYKILHQMVSGPGQSLQSHHRLTPGERMWQVAVPKLSSNEPGINPVIFRSIQEVGLFIRIDQAGVKHIDLNIRAAKVQMALQVHGRMSGVTTGMFQSETYSIKAMFIYQLANSFPKLHNTRSIIKDTKARQRTSLIVIGQTTDCIVRAAYIDTDKQRVRHYPHLLCNRIRCLQSWDVPGKPMNDNLASYWNTPVPLGALASLCWREGGVTGKQSVCGLAHGARNIHGRHPYKRGNRRYRIIPLVDTYGIIFPKTSQDRKALI